MCMYCNEVMGEKEPFDDTSVTHGICDQDLEKLQNGLRVTKNLVNLYTEQRRFCTDKLF